MHLCVCLCLYMHGMIVCICVCMYFRMHVHQGRGLYIKCDNNIWSKDSTKRISVALHCKSRMQNNVIVVDINLIENK